MFEDWPNQTKSTDQTKLNQNIFDQTRPNLTLKKPNQPQPNHIKLDQTKPKISKNKFKIKVMLFLVFYLKYLKSVLVLRNSSKDMYLLCIY